MTEGRKSLLKNTPTLLSLFTKGYNNDLSHNAEKLFLFLVMLFLFNIFRTFLVFIVKSIFVYLFY